MVLRPDPLFADPPSHAPPAPGPTRVAVRSARAAARAPRPVPSRNRASQPPLACSVTDPTSAATVAVVSSAAWVASCVASSSRDGATRGGGATVTPRAPRSAACAASASAPAVG